MTTNTVAKMRWKFLLVSTVFSLFILVLCSFLFQARVVYALAIGLLFATFDNSIMLLDVEKGSKTTIEKAFIIMKKNMFKRIAFLAVSFFVAIKAGIYMPALFIAFFLIHFVCLVFFVITARGNDNSPECRKE